jgi:hypothetical protein
MTTKIGRGRVLTFRSVPRNPNGEIVVPDSVSLYLNYIHADGTQSTDPPVLMDRNEDGTWMTTFDTKVCENGPAFAIPDFRSKLTEWPPSEPSAIYALPHVMAIRRPCVRSCAPMTGRN